MIFFEIKNNIIKTVCDTAKVLQPSTVNRLYEPINWVPEWFRAMTVWFIPLIMHLSFYNSLSCVFTVTRGTGYLYLGL